MICLLYEEDVKYEKKNNRFIVNNHIFFNVSISDKFYCKSDPITKFFY